MRAAAAAARHHQIIRTARQIAQQDIVLHKACGGLLIHQAGRSITGVVGVAVCIRRSILLAAVAAGDVDVAILRVGSGRSGIVLRTIASRAGGHQQRCSRSSVGLAILADDLRAVVNNQCAPDSAGSIGSHHISNAVIIGVDTRHIGPGNTNGHALLIRQFRIGYRADHGQRPCIGRSIVCPFLIGIVCQVQYRFDIGAV